MAAFVHHGTRVKIVSVGYKVFVPDFFFALTLGFVSTIIPVIAAIVSAGQPTITGSDKRDQHHCHGEFGRQQTTFRPQDWLTAWEK